MPPSKRKREEEHDMMMKLAEGEALPAKGLLLRMFSSVARGLQADAVEWDVSGLLYKEDKPFSRSTVNAWLSCARCALHGPDELGAEDRTLLRTAEGLHAVLSFAHAVDSPVGLLTASTSQLQQLKFVVQLPEQRVEVAMSRKGLYWLADEETESDVVAPNQLGFASLAADNSIGKPCVSEQQRLELQQAVARQVGGVPACGAPAAAAAADRRAAPVHFLGCWMHIQFAVRCTGAGFHRCST